MEEKRVELIREVREVEIRGIEKDLKVKFPRSYRQFLLKRGEIEAEAGFRLPVFGLPPETERKKEKEEGIILSFQPGDLRRGGFAWIADYEGRIAGLCNRPECNLCNLKEREQLRDFEGGELKVDLVFYQRETKEFYIAHFVSFPKKKLSAILERVVFLCLLTFY